MENSAKEGEIMADYIYVTTVGASPDRARMLAEALARHEFSVISEASTGGSTDYDLKYNAASLILAWGRHPAKILPPEARVDPTFGIPVIIVKLDPRTVLPQKVGGISVIDLRKWEGGEHPELTRLVNILEKLSVHRLSRNPGSPLSSSVAEGANLAIEQIGELIRTVRRLDDVLAEDNAQTRALDATLRELADTYRVVKTAIQQFFSAAIGPNGIDYQAYVFLERGMLAETIHNGRAHCLRIGARYYREGGIRQALVTLADAELLKAADHTFKELTNSDHDLLVRMDRIGDALTAESRAIVLLLLTGQESAAQKRIAEARDLLLPLENKLDTALAKFKETGASLGYAEKRVVDQGRVQVTITNVTLGGGNVGCNIVVAELIKESSISLGAPGVPSELRQHLTSLHRAVAELSTELSDEEALLAAHDLRSLTDEVASGEPKEAFWKRATNGLLEAANKVGVAGSAVADLVTKVIALLS